MKRITHLLSYFTYSKPKLCLVMNRYNMSDVLEILLEIFSQTVSRV